LALVSIITQKRIEEIPSFQACPGRGEHRGGSKWVTGEELMDCESESIQYDLPGCPEGRKTPGEDGVGGIGIGKRAVIGTILVLSIAVKMGSPGAKRVGEVMLAMRPLQALRGA